MIAGHAHPEHPALHADGSHPPITFDRRTSFPVLREIRSGFSQDVALHLDPRQLCTQSGLLHLQGTCRSRAVGPLQCALTLRLDPIEQCLFDQTQPPCRCRDTLARFSQPDRLLLEIPACNAPALPSSYPSSLLLFNLLARSTFCAGKVIERGLTLSDYW
jgi:hypothetical protein